MAIASLGLALWAGTRAHSGQAPADKTAVPHTEQHASNLNITHGPIVEYVSSQHAVVSWTTDVTASSVLKFGTSKTNLNMTDRSRWRRKSHSIELSKLKPDTTYYFQVFSSLPAGATVSSSTASFKTKGKGARPMKYPDGR